MIKKGFTFITQEELDNYICPVCEHQHKPWITEHHDCLDDSELGQKERLECVQCAVKEKK